MRGTLPTSASQLLFALLTAAISARSRTGLGKRAVDWIDPAPPNWLTKAARAGLESAVEAASKPASAKLVFDIPSHSATQWWPGIGEPTSESGSGTMPPLGR